MELARKQNQSALVEKVSQNVTVQALAVNNFKKASDTLPVKIQGTFDIPKVREMILATGEKSVQGFIEFELIKLAERINVSGNLTDAQIEFIASQLVGAYPNETIADFKLCFEGLATGKYSPKGKLFKLDGVEVGQAMQMYLDEKYTVLETELMKEKDELWKKQSSNTDWLQVWKEAIDKTDAEGGVKTQSQNMAYFNHVKAMTEKEIDREGQERPRPKTYPSTPLSVIEQRELHIQWIKENYDPYTAKPLPGWISEEEWLKKQTTP